MDRLLLDDSYLLTENLSERSISHRLGIYRYQAFLASYDVDCKYNQFVNTGKNRKYILADRRRIVEIGKIEDNSSQEETVIGEVLPDIIIHHRGNSEDNLLAIEVKKSKNCCQKERRYNEGKLKRYTSGKYGNLLFYKYRVFILIDVGEKPDYSLTWFQNGQKI